LPFEPQKFTEAFLANALSGLYIMPPIMVPLEQQAATDLAFLDLAIEMVKFLRISCTRHNSLTMHSVQAEEAAKAQEIPVGCVFVRDGQVIAKGRNRTNETRNVSYIFTKPRKKGHSPFPKKLNRGLILRVV
jgi:hypothetical protein